MGNGRAIVLVVKIQEYHQGEDWLRVNLPELDLQVVQEEAKLHARSRQLQDAVFPVIFLEELRDGALGDPVGRSERHVLELPGIHEDGSFFLGLSY